ncbi:MAG TPA: AzlD domain-containing protein [Firmicutes bacterium]|nr:AzlD domain-containing protein [Bacillota bacterium]
MDSKTFALMLGGMFLVTYASRVLPIMVLSRLRMPQWLLNWLSFVPAAVLTALLAPAILMPDGSGDLILGLNNQYLIASIPTLVMAIRTRNLILSVAVGVVTMAILRYYPG